MGLERVSLADKYALSRGRIFLTGIQALVRLTLAQARRDPRAGLDTRGRSFEAHGTCLNHLGST